LTSGGAAEIEKWIFFAASRILQWNQWFRQSGFRFRQILGVTSVASGKSFSFRFSGLLVQAIARRWWIIENRNQTISAHFLFFKKFATTKTFSAENSIPVFTARGLNSSNAASICWRSILATRFNSQNAPWILRGQAGNRACAVNAERGEGFKSACTPAPPPLSEPAMVKADGQIFFAQPFSKINAKTQGCKGAKSQIELILGGLAAWR